MLKRFLDNIELWLSGLGVLIVFVVSVIIMSEEGDRWKVAAITALIVSVLHGLIFWAIRRRQRRIREQSISEIKEMLADVVKNQLAVIGLWLPDREDRGLYDVHVEGIKDSVGAIEQMVDSLSEESLRSWKVQYKEAVSDMA